MTMLIPAASYADNKYDFSMFTGGARSTLGFVGKELFVEVSEDLSTTENDVLLKFTIATAEPLTHIPYVYFDTGTHTDLIADMFIKELSSGVAWFKLTPNTHPFLAKNFTTDIKFGQGGYPWNQKIYGVNPGEYAILTAVLGDGKTYADLINALNEGIAAGTQATGLRIQAFVYDTLGTTLYDDAAFVTNSLVATSEPPPPPPPPPPSECP